MYAAKFCAEFSSSSISGLTHFFLIAVQYRPASKKRKIGLRLCFLFSLENEHEFLKRAFLIFASNFCFFLNFLTCSRFLSHIC